MAFDVQQGLLEEGQPLDFMLLALVKHLLHAFHVLRSAFVQFLQRLLILFFSLRQKTDNTLKAEASMINNLTRKKQRLNYYFYFISWPVHLSSLCTNTTR